jgi:hypothetical protein
VKTDGSFATVEDDPVGCLLRVVREEGVEPPELRRRDATAPFDFHRQQPVSHFDHQVDLGPTVAPPMVDAAWLLDEGELGRDRLDQLALHHGASEGVVGTSLVERQLLCPVGDNYFCPPCRVEPGLRGSLSGGREQPPVPVAHRRRNGWRGLRQRCQGGGRASPRRLTSSCCSCGSWGDHA